MRHLLTRRLRDGGGGTAVLVAPKSDRLFQELSLGQLAQLFARPTLTTGRDHRLFSLLGACAVDNLAIANDIAFVGCAGTLTFVATGSELGFTVSNTGHFRLVGFILGATKKCNKKIKK